jgi:hypothetical protein
VVDGTKPGSRKCSNAQGAQNFGPKNMSGTPLGLNGVMVYEADNVWVQNLTVCNFLGGAGQAGNGIWWNGAHGSGGIHGWGFLGSYLTATSTYYRDETTAATYGIFSSDWSGGKWDQAYTSNFNDSGFYIGACQQVCNQTLDHGWSEFNALGYSGTNSGGQVIIEHSQFDNNEDGFDTNSQNNDDFPSPQDGACPTGTRSCWVFMDNYVHDNNNPFVPAAGAAAAGPVGTGVSVSGGRDDTIMNNRFVRNGAWGVILVPYPDTETPPPNAPNCAGGAGGAFLGITLSCIYDDWGNALIGNTFTKNGFFGNPSNGDFAEETNFPGHPINCYRGNVDTAGAVKSSPPTLQTTNKNCGQTALAPDTNPVFTTQVLCDSLFLGPNTPCPPGANYPRSRGKVIMHPLPPARDLPTMPNPCAGVPANAWCTAATRKPAARKPASRRGTAPTFTG